MVTCRGLLADWTTFPESLPPFYLVFSLLMLSGQVGYLVSVKERCQNVLMTPICTSIRTTASFLSSRFFHNISRNVEDDDGGNGQDKRADGNNSNSRNGSRSYSRVEKIQAKLHLGIEKFLPEG